MLYKHVSGRYKHCVREVQTINICYSDEYMSPGSIEQQGRCLHVSRTADQPGAYTCFEHYQVQRVVPDVGDCCDVVDGHAQDDVLAITPDQLDIVRRQAHHGVLLRRELTSQLVGLLEGRSGTPRDPELRSDGDFNNDNGDFG